MDSTITISTLLEFAAIVGGIWGFYKIIIEICKAINSRHDKEQEWDKIKDMNGKHFMTLEEYEIDKAAVLQELKAELSIMSSSILAILDGLKQLDCDGPVTEAKIELERFLNDQAHK